MIPFLKCVARNYASRYTDLSRLCFVFPSRRAATFFRKYLSESVRDEVIISPLTITMDELAADLSEAIPDTRIDLLFTLFDAYRSLNSESETKQVDFDSFRMWGEVVLADFNEVDLWNVNPADIFKNVRDYKEIETDYLTEEQRGVMEEYFGVASYKDSLERFWRHYDYGHSGNEDAPSTNDGTDSRQTDIKEKFALLWQVLGPLYEKFNGLLDQRGLTYPGKAWKMSLANLRARGLQGRDYDKFVFVGLNALTKAEFMLLHELKGSKTTVEGREEPLADFFWDNSSPLFSDPQSSAGRFVRRDIAAFPQPEWADMSACDAAGAMPHIEIVSSPSEALQTKLAGMYVERMTGEQTRSDGCSSENVADDFSNVAIVLPDENLVLPMLYSLPQSIKSVNLTMGFPLKLTSAASYVRLLKRLQLTRTVSGGETMYRAADLVRLFSHPFLMAICPVSKVQKLKKYIFDLRKYRVSITETVGICPEAASLLVPIAGGASSDNGRRWLEEALETAYIAISCPMNRDQRLSPSLDRDYLELYGDAVRRISTALDEHKIDVNAHTYLALVEKLLAGETVSFEGEPLEGLQVMGMLETRCLDFDHLIVLSVNERVLPKRARMRSFVPAGLRRAYGMPFAGYDESIFSYYFYRMLSRARTATLIYDARDVSPQTTPSRYLLQLKHLYGGGHVSFTDYTFMLDAATPQTMEVTKDDACLARLEPFSALPDADGDSHANIRYFSSSALTKYLDCPMRFYFNIVLGIDPPNDMVDGLDPIMEGQVVHGVMMQVYLPENERRRLLPQGRLIEARDIDAILERTDDLRDMVRTEVNKQLYGEKHPEKWNADLNPLMQVSADMLERQIKDILEYDRSQTPFRLYGVEVPETIRFDIDEDSEVNMKCVIDRIDDCSGIVNPDGRKALRIVDYKTGTAYVSAESVEEACHAATGAKHLFQLQLYANIHNRLLSAECHQPLAMAIYNIRGISARDESKHKPLAEPRLCGKKLKTHLDDEVFNQTFIESVQATIREILDPSVPFRQTDDEKKCRYCTLKDYCMR